MKYFLFTATFNFVFYVFIHVLDSFEYSMIKFQSFAKKTETEMGSIS